MQVYTHPFSPAQGFQLYLWLTVFSWFPWGEVAWPVLNSVVTFLDLYVHTNPNVLPITGVPNSLAVASKLGEAAQLFWLQMEECLVNEIIQVTGSRKTRNLLSILFSILESHKKVTTRSLWYMRKSEIKSYGRFQAQNWASLKGHSREGRFVTSVTWGIPFVTKILEYNDEEEELAGEAAHGICVLIAAFPCPLQ